MSHYPDPDVQPPPPHLLHWRGHFKSIFTLLGILIMVGLLAMTVGSVNIPLPTVFQAIISRISFLEQQTVRDTTITIIMDIRLPRIILAGLVGAALAVAGATYQGLFRNPLADPYLIGVAQGAALGAVIGFLIPAGWFVSGYSIVPIFGFIGALMTTLAVYGVARVGKTLPMTTLILAGVALGALLWAMTSYLLISSGDKLHGIIFWLMGSFSLSKWSDVRVILPYIVSGTLIIGLYARQLNIIQLDEEQAQQLGINVERMKLVLISAATLITAAAVSFVGVIGFVGIIIPHAVRLLWGADYRFLLPLSLLAGSIFLILSDLIARTALSPNEIPIGVITAIVGAPFFLYLLKRKKKVIF